LIGHVIPLLTSNDATGTIGCQQREQIMNPDEDQDERQWMELTEQEEYEREYSAYLDSQHTFHEQEPNHASYQRNAAEQVSEEGRLRISTAGHD
jgi:hypothetical protein